MNWEFSVGVYLLLEMVIIFDVLGYKILVKGIGWIKLLFEMVRVVFVDNVIENIV